MGNRPWQRRTRVTAALVAVICVGLLVGSAVAGPSATTADDRRGSTATPDAGGTSASGGLGPAADDGDRGLTVVTTQAFYTGLRPGARDGSDLLAFDGRGSLVYRNSTYDAYFDVDPVAGTRATVEYVAARRLGGTDCAIDPCSENLVERVNLTTGAVTRIYDAVTPQYDTGRWHDVDRVNETHLGVADIVRDRVYVVDIRTEEISWQWNASDRYPRSAGGRTGDWTHLNDIEVLEDGRFMVSLRNMDTVVFLRPDGGAVEGWTLGHDGAHGILHEAHNPDFIPAERGGPAVVVADSENNRVVEYRREGGRWRLTWSWRDRALQWPRDADRLPDGRTLVVDSHGDRVIEVDPDGHVVWSVEVGRPYDAERLGTGDESETGYAAGSVASGNDSIGTTVGAPPATRHGPTDDGVPISLKAAVPGPWVNGLLFVSPPWVGFGDLLVGGVLLADLVLWLAVEWHWSRWSLRRRARRLAARLG